MEDDLHSVHNEPVSGCCLDLLMVAAKEGPEPYSVSKVPYICVPAVPWKGHHDQGLSSIPHRLHGKEFSHLGLGMSCAPACTVAFPGLASAPQPSSHSLQHSQLSPRPTFLWAGFYLAYLD